jgi:3-deoxy-D-manno-octulosonic-acid transferase
MTWGSCRMNGLTTWPRAPSFPEVHLPCSTSAAPGDRPCWIRAYEMGENTLATELVGALLRQYSYWRIVASVTARIAPGSS